MGPPYPSSPRTEISPCKDQLTKDQLAAAARETTSQKICNLLLGMMCLPDTWCCQAYKTEASWAEAADSGMSYFWLISRAPASVPAPRFAASEFLLGSKDAANTNPNKQPSPNITPILLYYDEKGRNQKL